MNDSFTGADSILHAIAQSERMEWTSPLRDRHSALVEEFDKACVLQSRRLSSPLADHNASIPALDRIVEQIRILSQLIESELLMFHEVGSTVLPMNTVRRLLDLKSEWIERLENQLWLLDSTRRQIRDLHNALELHRGRVAGLKPVARAVYGSVIDIPDPLLLFPEAGMVVSREVALPFDEHVLRRDALSIQSARMIVWSSHRIRSWKAQRNALLRDSLLSRNQPDPVAIVRRLAELSEDASLEAAERAVLPDLRDVFLPAAKRLYAEALSGRFSERETLRLLRILNLDPRIANETNSLTSAILFRRLRRHQPQTSRMPPQSAGRARRLARMFGNSTEQQPAESQEG